MHNRTDKKPGWRRPSRDITVTLALVLVIVLALAFFRGESMSIRAIERPTYPENGNFESLVTQLVSQPHWRWSIQFPLPTSGRNVLTKR